MVPALSRKYLSEKKKQQQKKKRLPEEEERRREERKRARRLVSLQSEESPSADGGDGCSLKEIITTASPTSSPFGVPDTLLDSVCVLM